MSPKEFSYFLNAGAQFQIKEQYDLTAQSPNQIQHCRCFNKRKRSREEIKL